MSGFEVAGIILGSIPLVISALEHYRDGASAIRRWSRYENERRSLILRLETESVKMQNICTQLLRGLIADSQIEGMIVDPFGPSWQSEELQRKLRGRLCGSARVFKATVAEINDAIQKILGLLNPPQQKAEVQGGAEPSAVRREFRRIVFTLSRSSYSNLMSTIKEGICSLDMLTAQCIDLEPGRQQASHAKLATLMKGLSVQLHQALQRSLSCSCSHGMSIRLCKRATDALYEKNEQTRLRLLPMHVALSFAGDTVLAADPFQGNQVWKLMRIYASPDQRPIPRNVTIPATASMHLYALGIAESQPSHISSDRIRVSQASTATLIQSANVTSLAGQIALPAASTVLREPEPIRNLCHSVQTWPHGPWLDRCGFIVHESSTTRRRFNIEPALDPFDIRHNRDFVCLRDVLDGHVSTPWLSYKQRMELAVTISTGVLHLQDTPWLHRTTLSESIVFSRNSSANLYENPFLVKGDEATGTELSYHSPDTLPRNPIMISLAFLLIELMLGPVILYPGEGIEMQYIKAQRKLPALYAVSKNYFSAVSRCLNDATLHATGLGEGEFQQNMYTGIVSLLEKDLEIM